MAEKLSRKTKIIYGAGDLGFSLTSTIIGAFFLLFLTDVIHLRPAYAGRAHAGDGAGRFCCLARYLSRWRS